MIDKEEEKIVLGKHIGVIYLLYLTYIQTKQTRFWVRKKTSKLSGWLLVALDILVFLYVVIVCVLFVCWIISIYLSHQICSWAEQSLWDKVMTFICIIMHYIRFDIVRSWVACRSVHMHIMYIYFACSIFTSMYDYMHMREVANMSKDFLIMVSLLWLWCAEVIRRQKSLVTFVDWVSRHFEGSQYPQYVCTYQ